MTPSIQLLSISSPPTTSISCAGSAVKRKASDEHKRKVAKCENNAARAAYASDYEMDAGGRILEENSGMALPEARQEVPREEEKGGRRGRREKTNAASAV